MGFAVGGLQSGAERGSFFESPYKVFLFMKGLFPQAHLSFVMSVTDL